MSKEKFVTEAEKRYEEVSNWRKSNPGASYDELVLEVTKRRQALMGGLLTELAQQEGSGDYLEERECPKCEGVMHYKGENEEKGRPQ